MAGNKKTSKRMKFNIPSVGKKITLNMAMYNEIIIPKEHKGNRYFSWILILLEIKAPKPIPRIVYEIIKIAPK
ncbi:MAG: hypothetical protein V3V78_01960 [Candidatus Woesearchaeota archaeon]